MALDSGFEELAKKSESYEICFIPDNDYRSFLKRRVEGLEEKVNDGDFVLDGKVIGKHRGYPFYTIGQRKGLEIALGEPMFVTEVNPQTNVVVLGTKEDLQKQAMVVGRYNLIKYAELPAEMEAHTKIRYKDPGAPATLNESNGKIYVNFHRKVNAVTPGQSAVFYEGDDIVGGGFIELQKS
jgi:tRNA-specific 2-thiouridylase